MGLLSSKLRNTQDDGLTFWCPGCDEPHNVNAIGWNWDGNVERPTFSPSILIRSGHYARHFNPANDVCWCTYNREHPEDAAPFTCRVCHSFVKEGRVQFLGDCTHALAGQTVDLPDLPEHMRVE